VPRRYGLVCSEGNPRTMNCLVDIKGNQLPHRKLVEKPFTTQFYEYTYEHNAVLNQNVQLLSCEDDAAPDYSGAACITPLLVTFAELN
jgi:hypothetical protein